jgi:hypothetical protein
MSLFLHPQNQSLLWETIHSIPIFPTFVQRIVSKERWFKEQIEMIYQNTNAHSVSKESLSALNRTAIQYMVESMKREMASTPSTNKELSREWISGQKKNQLNAVFQERQKAYEAPVTTSPPAVSFSETNSDGPITNMEELIKQHMAERDLLAAPPPTTSTQNPLSIKISNEPPQQPIPIISVDSLQSQKKVRFAEDGFSAILQAIGELNGKIDAIFKELEDLKSYFPKKESIAELEERG